MSESSRKATISRGIIKRKGIRSRVCTRNRSKMEKIRESLNNLKIEVKQIKPIRNKVSRGDPSARSWFHDCDLEGSSKRYSCLQRKGEKSPVNSESLSRSERCKAKCDSSPGMTGRNKGKSKDQLEKCFSDWNHGDSQTSKSCSPMSENVRIVGDTRKRKCDTDLQANIAIDKDQSSPSPPNSPLYDMPPPSTLAQKQERRAKRLLQLERWKKCETSRSRQERYKRRAQEAAETIQKSVSMDTRRVQWSQDLVQTVYIDDLDNEPNLMDSSLV